MVSVLIFVAAQALIVQGMEDGHIVSKAGGKGLLQNGHIREAYLGL